MKGACWGVLLPTRRVPSDLALPLGGPTFLLISALAVLAAPLTPLARICDPETRAFEDKLKELFM